MNCPECAAALPEGAAFRFCPYCGSGLAATTPNPALTDPYVPDVADKTNPVSDAATLPEIQALSNTGSNIGAERPMDELPLDETRVDAAPVPASAASTARDTQEGPSAENDPHEAPTRMELPAITEALLGKAAPSKTSAQPARRPSVADDPTIEVKPVATPKRAVVRPSAPAPAKPEAPAGGDKREFSETAWFLAAVSPEQLGETEGEATSFSEQEIMTDRYASTERLPTGVRKSFSLDPNRKRSSKETTASDSDDKPPKKGKS